MGVVDEGVVIVYMEGVTTLPTPMSQVWVGMVGEHVAHWGFCGMGGWSQVRISGFASQVRNGGESHKWC